MGVVLDQLSLTMKNPTPIPRDPCRYLGGEYDARAGAQLRGSACRMACAKVPMASHGLSDSVPEAATRVQGAVGHTHRSVLFCGSPSRRALELPLQP